jgi:hypothetical protein
MLTRLKKSRVGARVRAIRCRRRQRERVVLQILTVFLSPRSMRSAIANAKKIDRSLAIVVEASENLHRANFPLKS